MHNEREGIGVSCVNDPKVLGMSVSSILVAGIVKRVMSKGDMSSSSNGLDVLINAIYSIGACTSYGYG